MHIVAWVFNGLINSYIVYTGIISGMVSGVIPVYRYSGLFIFRTV